MDRNRHRAITPADSAASGKQDLSDRRKAERIVTGAMEDARRALKRIRSSNPERKNIFETAEMTEPFYGRRIRAAANCLPGIMKRFEKYQNLEPEDIAQFFAQPTCSISDLDSSGSLSTGAALWILDMLRGCRRMQKLYEQIPWLPDDAPIDIPVLFDSCHSDENIRSLVFVIQTWLQGRITHRGAISEDQEPESIEEQCARFSAIMGLIPAEAKSRAVRRLEEKIWEWTELCVSMLDDINGRRFRLEKRIQRLDEEIRETGEKLKQVQKGGAKKQEGRMNMPGPVMAPLAAPGPLDGAWAASAAASELLSGSNPFAAPGFGILGARQNDPMEQARRLDRMEDERNSIIEEERSLRIWAPISSRLSRENLKEYLGEERAKRLISFRVDDPFEMCFAFLCLLHQDDDLAWLYSFTLAVMDVACGQLPWAKGEYLEEEDTIWHPHDLLDMMDIDSEEGEETPVCLVDRALDEDWYGLKYTTDELYDVESERASIAQIVYQMTGAILPRNTRRYDGVRKQLRRDGLSNTRIDRAVSAMMILGEVQRQSRNWLFDEVIPDELPNEAASRENPGRVPAEPTAGAPDAACSSAAQSDDALAEMVEKLRAENAALKKENDKLRQAAHAATREVKETRQSMEKLEREAGEHTQELADLRELVFNQQNGEYEKAEPDSGIAFPYETRHRIVVFGGHDSWLREIRQKLPAVRFVDREASPNADLIRNADVIWIQANSLAHKHYYKIIDVVRKYDKPIRYFAYASATKCAGQVVEEDRKE